MNLDKVRAMSDSELETYLKSLSNKRDTNCVKCGKPNSNYVMNIKNNKKLQQKKLCNLCESCYNDLLNYLDTCDIIWD